MIPGSTVLFLSVADDAWGAERSMTTLAKEMKDAGVHPELLCTSEKLAAFWSAEVGSRSTIVHGRCGGLPLRVSQNLFLWHRAFKSNPDAIVVFSYILAFGCLFVWPFKKSRRTRLVLDLHDNLSGPRGVFLLRLFTRFFDVAVHVSRYTAGQLDGLKIEQHVIYRPVKAQPVRSVRRLGQCRVGVIGRIVEQKRIDLVIDACAQVGSPCTLTIRGSLPDGESDTSARSYARGVLNHGATVLGDRFRYEGLVPGNKALSDLDVLVVGNEREPMGRTVAEAQISGILVVVPDKGGSTELVEGGRTGLTYAATDVNSLAETLSWALAHPDECSAIAMQGQEAGLLRHDPVAYTTKYLGAVFGDI